MHDLGSVTDLYRDYGPMVLRRARAILRDEEAARDALQEVFVRVLKAGSRFRGESSPVTWLYRVTTNLCLNKIRDTGRRRQLLREHQVGEVQTSAPVAEYRVSLALVLRRVEPDLAEIAVYYYVDEMSQDEIAALLGVSRRTVSNRLHEFRRAARVVADGPTEEAG